MNIFPVIWAVGVADLIQVLAILLFALIPALIQAYNAYVEQKKKREILTEQREAITEYFVEKNDDYSYTPEKSDEYPAERNSIVRKAKKKPKQRQSAKTEQQVVAVAVPVVDQSVVKTVLNDTNEADPHILNPVAVTNSAAADILSIFQNPATMRQAIVISEIMKRPDF